MDLTKAFDSWFKKSLIWIYLRELILIQYRAIHYWVLINTDEERFLFYEALELYIINHEIQDQNLILDIKKFCQGINLTLDVFTDNQNN